MSQLPSTAEVIAFWQEAGPPKWFKKNPEFDAEIRARFEALHHAAARRELDSWAETADGALALLILLDQFPRNMWRNSAHAFATDPLAKMFAERAVAAGFDRMAAPQLQNFFHLPFEHSEALADQDRAVALAVDADALKWAEIHRDIIVRFGRFPHRNAALGRVTTAEEQAFLDGGGFRG